MEKNYRYLLFDADDTLIDFQKAEREAFHLTAVAGNLPYTEELYRTYSAINDSLWKRLEKGTITLPELKLERYRLLLIQMGYGEAEAAEKGGELRDFYISFLAEQAFLLPGAQKVCQVLSSRYSIYIITNGVSKIQRSRLKKTPLLPYVKDIFISEEIGAAKPSEAYFDHVLSCVGDADRSRYLVIGDSLTSDIAGAVRYGLDCCWVNRKGLTTTLPVTYTVSELDTLLTFL